LLPCRRCVDSPKNAATRSDFLPLGLDFTGVSLQSEQFFPLLFSFLFISANLLSSSRIIFFFLVSFNAAGSLDVEFFLFAFWSLVVNAPVRRRLPALQNGFFPLLCFSGLWC